MSCPYWAMYVSAILERTCLSNLRPTYVYATENILNKRRDQYAKIVMLHGVRSSIVYVKSYCHLPKYCPALNKCSNVFPSPVAGSHGCYNINTSVIFDPSDNRLGRAVDVTPFNLSACLTTCSSIGYYFSVPYRSIPGNVSCGCIHDYQDLGARNEAACTDRCGNVSCAGVNAGGVFSPPGTVHVTVLQFSIHLADSLTTLTH